MSYTRVNDGTRKVKYYTATSRCTFSKRDDTAHEYLDENPVRPLS